MTLVPVDPKSEVSVVTFGPFSGSPVARNDQIAVYVAYANDGQILYVGQTNNLRRRLREHRARSPWWLQAADVRYLPTDVRLCAIDLERDLIRIVSPVHNILGRTA